MNRLLILTTSLLTAQCAMARPAVAAAADAETLRVTAAVVFHASSTLHDFDGRAAPVAFTLEPAPGGRWSAAVAVPAASLTTDNDGRDENLRAMLDVAHYPVVRARFAAIDAAAARDSKTLPFVLGIRAIERNLVANLSAWHEDAEQLSFDAAFVVSLKEFELEAPSVLGFISVGDQVRVSVHVEVHRP